MKKVLLIMAFLIVEIAVSQEKEVDIETSVLEWIGSKPMDSHNGILKLSQGILTLENEKIKSGDFVIDMNTINCLDLKSGNGKERLEGHLKDGDFFDVAKFPTAKFAITEVEEKGEKLEITGDLTIKNKTKSISFPATLKTTETGYSLVSNKFKINRLDFGVTYKSKTIFAKLKDKFINDEIEFIIKLNVKK